MDKPGPIWIVRAGECAIYVDEFPWEGAFAMGSEAGSEECPPGDDWDSRCFPALGFLSIAHP
jgi:hypothetical protein